MTLTHSLKVALCAGAALTLAACATAPQSSTTAKATPEKTMVESTQMTKTADSETLDPNEEICKRQKVTGSNFKKRVCATRAQWDEMQRSGKKVLGGMQDGQGGYPEQAGGG